MFAKRHIKNARHLLKSAEKFLHYKKDIISAKNLKLIIGKMSGIKEAIKRDASKKELDKLSQNLTSLCKSSIPNSLSNTAFAENIEVFFVAIIIAVSIKTFFIQPFKIPTGSMQPTLNGITTHAIDKKEKLPSGFKRFFDGILRGITYIDVTFPRDDVLIGIEGGTYFRFFPRTYVYARSGEKYTFKCRPQDFYAIAEDFQDEIGRDPSNAERLVFRGSGMPVKAGKSFGKGYVETGDQVFVNKLAYNFRRPRLGEVFVFKTTNIKGIEQRPDFLLEYGSQHYIKRLCALPNSFVVIDEPNILVNASVPKAFGMQRVMSAKGGYSGYHPSQKSGRQQFRTGEGEYLAFGDNTDDSFDSREWGTVDEHNLVGSALMVYWPFSNRWGFIK